MKSYLTSIQNEFQRFWKDISYKIKNIAESNEELCYYYFFNKNYNDLKFRLKFLSRFYPDYIPFRFFQAMCFLIDSQEKEALNELEYIAEKLPNHPFAYYYINALKDKISGKIPMEIIQKYFDISAPFFSRLDKYENEAYISQINSAHKLFKLEQDQIKILDLGCGNGLFTKKISHLLGKLPEILGVDNCQKMLDIASERKLSNDKKLYETLKNEDIALFLNSDNDKYDIIICSKLINYYNDLSSIFTSIETKMLPSSSLIIGFEFDDRLDSYIISKDYLKYIYSREYIKNLLKQHNLRIVNQEIQATSGFNVYIVKKNS